MTYDSLDIIPLKLFLRIRETEQTSLLSDDPLQFDELEKIWNDLKEKYDELFNDNDGKKTLDLMTRIEILNGKYHSIKVALQCLGFGRSLDLENMLRSYGYKLTESNFLDDLKAIDGFSESLIVKIKRIEQNLPKIDGKVKKSTIDRVISGYCSITGLMYDSNKITVTQFDALKSTYQNKIKAMEDLNRKNKQKLKSNSRR